MDRIHRSMKKYFLCYFAGEQIFFLGHYLSKRSLNALLDNGIETMLGEKGSQISGGQKQRIGIARALYKKSEMIIFDEATNALDENTESKIIELISDLSQDKTIVFVTHNSKNLSICDNVYKSENGIIKNYN